MRATVACALGGAGHELRCSAGYRSTYAQGAHGALPRLAITAGHRGGPFACASATGGGGWRSGARGWGSAGMGPGDILKRGLRIAVGNDWPRPIYQDHRLRNAVGNDWLRPT